LKKQRQHYTNVFSLLRYVFLISHFKLLVGEKISHLPGQDFPLDLLAYVGKYS